LAAAGNNVSGYAWSENIGWIKFDGPNYGVRIDPNNGKLSGYAWSSNIGWIKFDPSSPYPGFPNQSARLDFNNNQITGWARACAGTVNGDCASSSRTDGWDGWIKMSGTNYGVIRSGCKLQGFAWGSDVIGWIKFSGENYGVTLAQEVCENRPPAIQSNSISVSQPDYCSSPPMATVSWIFSDPDPGDYQTAYQVQISSNPGFGTPEVDSGKATSSSASYTTPTGLLQYNTKYFTRVKVWDSRGAESSWVEGPSFSTPKHVYPTVDFSWKPVTPAKNESIQFEDKSTVFGGVSKSSWQWTFQEASPNQSTSQNPVTQFTSSGTKTVTLRLTDSDGYACQASKEIRVKFALPKWKEIIPFF